MLSKIKTALKHKGLMRYLKNTSWLGAEHIIRILVGFFVTVWFIRYLGPEQFGVFSYAQALVALFTAIFGLSGLDGIVVRELIKNSRANQSLMVTAFFIKLFGAILVLMALFASLAFIDQDNLTIWLIFIIASANLFHSFNIIEIYFQSIFIAIWC